MPSCGADVGHHGTLYRGNGGHHNSPGGDDGGLPDDLYEATSDRSLSSEP